MNVIQPRSFFAVATLVAIFWSASSSAAFFFPKTVAELIYAINASNSNGQNDAIDLDDNTFTLSAINNRFNGLPTIKSDNGHTLLIRRGVIERSFEPNTPIFRLVEIFPNANVTFDLITFRNGTVGGSAHGGAIAISNDAVVSVKNCIFDKNTSGNSGGAIYAGAKSRIDEITKTMFSNNKASFGASISADNAMIALISASVFSYNDAGSGGGIHLLNRSEIGELVDLTFMNNDARANGGAIYAFGSTIKSILQSTFNNNKAVNNGGAIMIVQATIDTLANSTITKNSASTTGGGIAVFDNATIKIIANSTITQNKAAIGGGLGLNTRATVTKLESTIVAANSSDLGPDINGSIGYESFNLIGINKGSNVAPGNPNIRKSKVGTVDKPLNPLLGPLTNNGGATRTHALLPLSPALDSGSNFLKLEFDQRGEGFPRFLANKVDIGAYEQEEE